MRRVEDLVNEMYNFNTLNFKSYDPFNYLIRLFREYWFNDELKPCEYFITNTEVDDYE